MYDAMVKEGGGIHWSDTFNSAKVLCFSSELQRRVSRYTPRCSHFQYYPDPRPYRTASRRKELRWVFWSRVPAIDENVIARLCGDTVFDRFTLHDAPDPLSGARVLKKSPIPSRAIRKNGWWKNRKDYLADVAQHNVFFAPRTCEGIGMGMLEAMAMGLCVVAADRPPHNEYISHETTGLLYDPANVQPVRIAKAADLGARARESVEKGFRQWAAAEDQLLSFVSLPTRLFDQMLTRCSA